VLRREHLDAIKYEENLRIHRIFHPQGAVIVEGGDALGRFDVVPAVLIRDGSNKFQDRLLRRSVVPRRQWIGGV